MTTTVIVLIYGLIFLWLAKFLLWTHGLPNAMENFDDWATLHCKALQSRMERYLTLQWQRRLGHWALLVLMLLVSSLH